MSNPTSHAAETATSGGNTIRLVGNGFIIMGLLAITSTSLAGLSRYIESVAAFMGFEIPAVTIGDESSCYENVMDCTLRGQARPALVRYTGSVCDAFRHSQ